MIRLDENKNINISNSRTNNWYTLAGIGWVYNSISLKVAVRDFNETLFWLDYSWGEIGLK
jgi:hypothetical protein